MLGWMKHKLESRLQGEISIISDMHMTPPLSQLASIRQMSRQVSRGSAGEYQEYERAGVARLSWRVSGR